MHILESIRCFNVIPLENYSYVKTKMLADVQICISVPLIRRPSSCSTKRHVKVKVNKTPAMAGAHPSISTP